jgi:hypothetical protein
MTWALNSSGTTSLTTISQTLTTLVTETTNFGTFVAEFDLSAMANGDLLLLLVNDINLSGGSQTALWKGYFQNVQSVPHKVTPPVAIDQGIQLQVARIGGTIPLNGSGTGGVTYGTVGTGQATTATALMLPLGPSPMVVGATSVVVTMTSTTAFNTSEAIFCTTSSNQCTVSGSPAAFSLPWKLLRI